MAWQPEVYRTRSLVWPHSVLTRDGLSRAVDREELRRVRRGVYVDFDEWRELSNEERYRLRVQAVAATRRRGYVVSHWSAAACHALPLVGEWPSDVYLLAPGSSGRSRHGIIERVASISPEDIVRVGSLEVTSIARTIIDMAAELPLRAGVAMADAALFSVRQRPRCTPDELFAALDRRGRMRARRRVEQVLEFATSLSGSPLESVSRVEIVSLGFPTPELQVAFRDDAGFIAECDFTWKKFGVIGEADGNLKYLDSRFRNGRTADEVVLDEKRREDRLRALGFRVVRWEWRDVIEPARLRAKLEGAGVLRHGR